MNLGLPEMIFIFLLALIIFGPKKLPEIGRQIGKAMGEFKRASNDFKSQIEGEIRNLELEEATKREAAPQILPPEHTHAVSPNVGGDAVSDDSHPGDAIGTTGNPQPLPTAGDSVGRPEISAGHPASGASEQAKAADV